MSEPADELKQNGSPASAAYVAAKAAKSDARNSEDESESGDEDEEEYEIEDILGHQRQRNVCLSRTHWVVMARTL